MRILSRSGWRRGDETHRWFPEWADRMEGAGVLLESDRNSYSAGGYAEEFGYRDQAGLPPPAPVLAGAPEGRKAWRIQIGALHPGYPECPRPLDRDRELAGMSRAPGPRQNAEVTTPSYRGELHVIRLVRPATSGSGAWEQIVCVWRGLRIRARHLDGF
jgi:hypothetical protein